MHLSTLLIDKEVADFPETIAIQTKLNLPTDIVDSANDIYRIISSSDDPVGKGKKTLFLTKNRGAFVKKCPGTSRYICCGYKILHIGTFCTMDCSYCILQAYFHPPVLQYFVNQQEMMSELDLNGKRGKVLGMDNVGKYQVINAHVPMAEFLTYAPDLRSMTGGRGIYTMEFSHYDEVPAQIAEKLVEENNKDKE